MKHGTYRLTLAIASFFVFQHIAMANDVKQIPFDEENISKRIIDARHLAFDEGENHNDTVPFSEYLSDGERKQIAKVILKSVTGGQIELDRGALLLRYEKDKGDNRYVRSVVSAIVHRLSKAANARFEADAQKRVHEMLGLAKADRSERIERLRTQCDEHEQAAVSLAQEIRVTSDAEGELWQESPEGEKLRSQLYESLSKAFDCRLEYQNDQLANARQDIATAESRLARRQELRQRIIDRRVEELIDGEDTTWSNDWRRWPVTDTADRDARSPFRKQARSEESENKDGLPLAMTLRELKRNDSNNVTMFFAIENESRQPYVVTKHTVESDGSYGGDTHFWPIGPGKTITTNIPVGESDNYRVQLRGHPSETGRRGSSLLLATWSSSESLLDQAALDAPTLKTVAEVEARVREMIEERKAITNAIVRFRWRGSGSYQFNRHYSVFVNGQYRRSDCRGVAADGRMDCTVMATPKFVFTNDRNTDGPVYSARDFAGKDVGWTGAMGDSIPDVRKLGWIAWNVESLDTHTFEEQLLTERRRGIAVTVEERDGISVSVVKFSKEDTDKVKDAWGEYWLAPSQGNYPVSIAHGWTMKADNAKYVISQRTTWKQFDRIWFPENVTYKYATSDGENSPPRVDAHEFELMDAEFNRSPFPDVFAPETTLDEVAARSNRTRSHENSTSTSSAIRPVFRGKSYDYWFRALQIERDAEVLKQAMEAMRVLVEDRDEEKVAAAIFRVMRVFGTASDGPKHEAEDALHSLEPSTVFDAIVAELPKSNRLSRRFLFRTLDSTQLPVQFRNVRAGRTDEIAAAWIVAEKDPPSTSDFWDIVRVAGWGEFKMTTKDRLTEVLNAVEPIDSEMLRAVLHARATVSPDHKGLAESIMTNEHLQPAEKASVLSHLGPHAVAVLPQIIVELDKLGPITGDRPVAQQHRGWIGALRAIGPKAKSALPLLRRLETEAEKMRKKLDDDHEQLALLADAIRKIEGAESQ